MSSWNSSNYVDVVRHQARVRGDETAFIFLNSDGRETETFSFADLDRRARAIAGELQQRNPYGKRALLLYDAGLEFIVGFLGCLYAGVIAVAVVPPSSREDRLDRLHKIALDCDAEMILASSTVMERFGKVLHSIGGRSLDVVFTDLLKDELADAWEMPPLRPGSLAFLQYTSGSSGKPAGVRISHRNLLANQMAIRQAFDHGPDTVFAGWTPLFHDMGLVGNVLQPLYLGVLSVLISPLTFLRRPAVWLRAISQYRATTSGGPNFGYDLCVDGVDELERDQLDLSSWSVAFNGAEPIRAGTLERFTETFSSCGFRKSAFQPCYGMAEATLLVTSAKASRPYVTISVDRKELEQKRVRERSAGKQAVKLVSSGSVQGGQHLIVIDRETNLPLADRAIGEILISGDSVASAYWRATEERANGFGARLPGDEDRSWFRTGDLGFLVDGELFVSGRCTELIIVRGRNHFPQDIEHAAEMADPALRQHSNAAFSAPFEAEERIVLVQEIKRTALHKLDPHSVASEIRAAIAKQLDLAIHEIVLVRPGSVPKTSSGKIRRAATRAAYLDGRFSKLALNPARSSAAQMPLPDRAALLIAAHPVQAVLIASGLATIVSAVLNRPAAEISPLNAMAALGVDSLAAVDIQKRLEDWLGTAVPLDLLISDRSIAELAAGLAIKSGERSPAPGGFDASGLKEGPASDYQQALWLRQRLEPDSNAYNLAIAIRLTLPLTPAIARAALAKLLHDYPALLTAFSVDLNNPDVLRQTFVTPAPLPLTFTDARSWSRAKVDATIARSIRRPFEIDLGRTFRGNVFQLGQSDHLLILSAHHLVTDLWSLQILVDGLADILGALCAGREPCATPPTPSAIDYACWQRSLLDSPRGDLLRSYWRNALTPMPPHLDLPVDTRLADFRPASRHACHFQIPVDLARRLDEICAETGVTAGMLYLAALQTLLHRYTGESDIVVSVPVAVRPDARFDAFVGYAVNPLPMRVDASGDPSFTQLLQRVRQTVVGALEHKEMPLIRLVNELRLPRENGRLAIGQVMLVWRGGKRLDRSASVLDAGRRIAFGDIEAVVEDLPLPTSQEDLVLTLTPATDGSVKGCMQFAPHLFRAETITRMVGHLLTLLQNIALEPSRRIGALSLLSAKERQVQLVEWNGEPPGLDGGESAVTRIEAQARRTPNRLALVCGEDEFSYADLAKRADTIAHHLRVEGIGRGCLVGVNLPRSRDLLPAMLGIWKAGAAYLPLDPALPPERLVGYVQDAGCALILTTGACPGQQRLGAPALDIATLADGSGEAIASNACPGDLAYVLFTSGSTGRPKGVEVEHGAVSSLLDWAVRQYRAEELAAVLAGTSISFDISIFELFAPLLAGGTVVLAESPVALPDIRHPVTLLNTVPSVAATLLAIEGIPASVKTINLAGEPLKQSLVDALYDRTCVERIYDLYGPTEDTIYSTFTLRERGGSDNIGRPLGGTRAYVVDSKLQPVPVGVAGELLLGGSKLARGYVGQPDLTALAFLVDTPLSEFAPRLYRTGDIVRQLPDGRFQYVGRRDHQIKIRGFRVELGEIEQQLLMLPEVRDAALLAQLDKQGEKRLIAYVTPAGTTPINASLLKARLAAKLPDFMLPSAYCVLRELPRNANGKLDRNLLPALEAIDDPTLDRTPPQTPTEHRVFRLWSALFAEKSFGIHENFFALGGDSLQALQLHAQIRREFDVDIPPAAVLAMPTISALAATLDLARNRVDAQFTEIVL